MTQDSLHRFRVDSCLVHQPVAQRVTKVMKPEPLTVMDLYPGCFSSRTEIASDKYGRGERNATFSLEGTKDKIPILPVEDALVYDNTPDGKGHGLSPALITASFHCLRSNATDAEGPVTSRVLF